MLNKNDIVYKLAQKDDAKIIYEIMNETYQNLENKNTFVCDTLNEIEEWLEKKGFGIIAYNNQKKIIGFLIVSYPGHSKKNLGYDIGLPKKELEKVAHMESTVVIPKYRGKGILQKLIQYAEKTIDRNNYKYFLATVSPDNPASFISLEKNGYQHIITKTKYNNLTRRIYLKKI